LNEEADRRSMRLTLLVLAGVLCLAGLVGLLRRHCPTRLDTDRRREDRARR
jgi:hypothetical protein